MTTIDGYPETRLKRADRIALKARLGLELAPQESAFVGKLRLRTAFKPEEVIDLLGDPERGIPRMLPVDVALSRLGMSMFKIAADGSAERVFGKLMTARNRSDRKIAEVVAKTRPPRDFFPEGVGFELFSSDVRLMVFHMHERRRLAGIVPFDDRGLFLGWWDECYSAFDVDIVGPRSTRAIYSVMVLMYVRDIVVHGPVPERMAGVEFYRVAAAAAEGGRPEFEELAGYFAGLERDPKEIARPVRSQASFRPWLNTPLSGRGHEAWREAFVSA